MSIGEMDDLIRDKSITGFLACRKKATRIVASGQHAGRKRTVGAVALRKRPSREATEPECLTQPGPRPMKPD